MFGLHRDDEVAELGELPVIPCSGARNRPAAFETSDQDSVGSIEPVERAHGAGEGRPPMPSVLRAQKAPRHWRRSRHANVNAEDALPWPIAVGARHDVLHELRGSAGEIRQIGTALSERQDHGVTPVTRMAPAPRVLLFSCSISSKISSRRAFQTGARSSFTPNISASTRAPNR